MDIENRRGQGFFEGSWEIANELVPAFFEFCYYTPPTLMAMAISTYEFVFRRNY
jgi:hypothetical protein